MAAYRAAVLGQQAALSSAMQQLRARLRSWLSGRGEAQQQQQEEEKDEDGAAAGGNSEGGAGAAVQLRKRTLAAAQNVLRRSAGAAGEVQGEGSELQRALQKLVGEEEHAGEVREGGAQVENVTAPEAQVSMQAEGRLGLKRALKGGGTRVAARARQHPCLSGMERLHAVGAGSWQVVRGVGYEANLPRAAAAPVR